MAPTLSFSCEANPIRPSNDIPSSLSALDRFSRLCLWRIKLLYYSVINQCAVMDGAAVQIYFNNELTANRDAYDWLTSTFLLFTFCHRPQAQSS